MKLRSRCVDIQTLHHREKGVSTSAAMNTPNGQRSSTRTAVDAISAGPLCAARAASVANGEREIVIQKR